ncbi:hypothetical protein Glove_661g31 [Diversispora epigaea]|uniref:Restriction endonuclease type IV Mrr domain-containing protein n=1 Tax=Diversispora epigaea TaxID=1348612 RepID=A0A397G7W0_9GLOM|nr:hypothetical protein Glove_661g31 [Diversispora epigaea]
MTKFQQEENSPVQKAGLLCGPGDKGINIKGMKKGVKFIIECKNWRTKNIDCSIINQIEGVLSRQSNGTIGIVAAPSMNRYTLGAKETARTSIYNVILVDVIEGYQTNNLRKYYVYYDKVKVIEEIGTVNHLLEVNRLTALTMINRLRKTG